MPEDAGQMGLKHVPEGRVRVELHVRAADADVLHFDQDVIGPYDGHFAVTDLQFLGIHQICCLVLHLSSCALPVR